MQFMADASAARKLAPVLPLERAACHCATLRRAARAVTQLYDEALAPAGLRLTQYSLMATVDRAGTIALTPLAGRLGMDRTTLTRNLAPLQARKLVALENERGRTKLARLTPRGRSLLLEAYPRWLDAQKRLAKKLGPEKTGSLAALGVALRA
jgi:DNA-binding MarR family transcriptional regulator